jgi:hypothetical protein
VNTQPKTLASTSNLRQKLIGLCFTNTLESSQTPAQSVGPILSLGGNSQIFTSTVKTIQVTVIDLNTMRHSEDNPVKEKLMLLAVFLDNRSGVAPDATFPFTDDHTPLVLRNAVVILARYDRNQTAGKMYFNRCFGAPASNANRRPLLPARSAQLPRLPLALICPIATTIATLHGLHQLQSRSALRTELTTAFVYPAARPTLRFVVDGDRFLHCYISNLPAQFQD